ncbi:MAG: Uncharacterised protein [Methanobacteriota archaeon]|nr:MAG: Uncharacterised protein [Euryarchaeota archaeon]
MKAKSSYPSLPLLAVPQHLIPLVVKIIQANLSPTSIRSAEPPTLTGCNELPISLKPSPRPNVSPSPNCPTSFCPQHFTCALSNIAQTLVEPASISTAYLEVPKSTTPNELPISPP